MYIYPVSSVFTCFSLTKGKPQGSRHNVLAITSKASYSYYSVPGVVACREVSKCCLVSLDHFRRGGKLSFAIAVTSLLKKGAWNSN